MTNEPPHRISIEEAFATEPHMSQSENHIAAPEFDRDAAAARRAASDAPLIVTDRGHPAHVLMGDAECERLRSVRQSVMTLFADPRPEADFDFEPERDRSLPRPVDLG